MGYEEATGLSLLGAVILVRDSKVFRVTER